MSAGVRRGRRCDERGAVAPLVALLTGLLIAMTAFTADLGMQRVARRDMQAVADVIALDMARLIDGRTTSALDADPDWSTQLDKSIERNSSGIGATPVVTTRLGALDDAGRFVPSAPDEVPTSVEVTAETSVKFAFAGGSGRAARTAVASTDATACFKLGSYALALNSQNSALLNALIGDALNIGALNYNDLADASVRLLDIGAELGAGSVDQLANLQGLTLGRFYLAMANVLQRNGDVANAQLLGTIAAQVTGLPVIKLADIIDLGSATDAALYTGLNVLDLVAGAAFVSNGTNFLAVPGLGVNLGISNIVSSLSIIEKPQTACGRVGKAQADTAQVGLDVEGKLLNLPLGLAGADANMDLHLGVGTAHGTLRGTMCGAGTPADPEGIDVSVGSGLTELNLTVPVKVTVNLGLYKVDITITARVTNTAPPQSKLAQLRYPPKTYEDHVSTGSGSLGVNGLAVSTTVGYQGYLLGQPVDDYLIAPLLTGVVGPLLSAVTGSLLPPLLAAIDATVVGPVAQLLGLEIAGADVYGLEPPSCTTPVLRG